MANNKRSLSHKAKTTVFVDIPPSPQNAKPPLKSSHKKFPIVFVDIPHSPLWRSSSTPSSVSAKSKKMVHSSATPAAPLVDRVNLKRKDAEHTAEDASNKKPRLSQQKTRVVQKKASLQTNSSTTVTAKPIIRRPRKVVAPPEPQWKLIQDAGSYKGVKDRMMLKEFFTRFSQLLSIGKTYLNVLDEITSYIPDAAIKAFLVALVDLLAADAADEDVEESLLETKGDLKKGRLSLNDMWAIMSKLKKAAPSLKLVDPAPRDPDAPARISVSPPPQRITRSKRNSQASSTANNTDDESEDSSTPRLHIDTTDQMIPVILSLIDYALGSCNPSIRADLDLGVTEKTKYKNQFLENQKADNDLWAEEKKKLNGEKQTGLKKEKELLERLQAKSKSPSSAVVTLSKEEKFDIDWWKAKYKAADDAHKAKLKVHNLRLHQQTSECTLRNDPKIGMDYDSRSYYLLSLPSQASRPPKTASPEDSSSTMKSTDDEEDGIEIKRWSWALAVWKPDDKEADDDDDDQAGQWYGFTEAGEIRKLVKWLEWRKAEQDKKVENSQQDVRSRGSSRPSARSSASLSKSTSTSVSRSSMTSMDLDVDEDEDEDEVDDLLTGQQPQRRKSKLSTAAARFDPEAIFADAPRTMQVDIKSLCKHLVNFADFLDWKLKKE